MKGLLQKAAGKVGSSQQKEDPVKDEIYAEIDGMVMDLHAETVSVSSDFSASRNDKIIPLLVVFGSIAVLIAGSLFFLDFYNTREKSITTVPNQVITAEGKILAAVKAQSEEQIQAREKEIQSIQGQLSRVVEDRNKLKSETARILMNKEKQLRKTMEDTLAAERAKLAKQGLTDEEIKRRITETTKKLEESNSLEMNNLKKQYEQELAEKENLMSKQIEEYQQKLAQSMSNQNRLEELIKRKEAELAKEFSEKSAALEDQKDQVLKQLQEVQNTNTREELVFSQILSSYKRIQQKMTSGEYGGALTEIASLEDFLKQDMVAGLPGIKSRVEMENFVITTLKTSIDMEQTIKEVFPREKAVLNSRIRKLEGKITEQNKELLTVEAERKRKERISARLAVLTTILSASLKQSPVGNSQDQVIDLLTVKVLLQQIVSTEPVKSEHPELEEEMGTFFNSFSNELEQEGRAAAVKEISSLLDYLGQDSSKGATAPPSGIGADMVQFLDKLRKLING